MNPIPDRSLEEPEERGPMCCGCDRRGPEEDLDRDGLCEVCREQTHYSMDSALCDVIEVGPPRKSCPCCTCSYLYRPRPFKESVSTPSIYDMLTIARVKRDSKEKQLSGEAP